MTIALAAAFGGVYYTKASTTVVVPQVKSSGDVICLSTEELTQVMQAYAILQGEKHETTVIP